MIIRSLSECEDTDRDVSDKNWRSIRLLLKKDEMGFSFHITTIKANSQIELEYKHHLEAVYCMKGHGSITDLKHNIKHAILPGTLYALNHHDRHIIEAKETLELACVFNPPCTGQEVHDDTGAYPKPEET